MPTGKAIGDHGLAAHDQTSTSEVAVCECGLSFLGGITTARTQWRVHATGETGTGSKHGPKHAPAATLSELVAGIDPHTVILSVPWDMETKRGRRAAQ